jgi:hypothetical protein
VAQHVQAIYVCFLSFKMLKFLRNHQLFCYRLCHRNFILIFKPSLYLQL